MVEILGTFDTKESHIKVYKTDYDFCKGAKLYIMEIIDNKTSESEIRYGTKKQMYFIVQYFKSIDTKHQSLLLGKLQ